MVVSQSETTQNAPRRIPELDGIRGIAILLVIGCHYEVFARTFWNLPKFGWIGVDIFFVLSGFLITSVLLNLRGRADCFRTFYSRRFRRILPPYIILLVLLYSFSAFMSDYALFNLQEVIQNTFFLQAIFHLIRPTVNALRHVGSNGWEHSQLDHMGRGLIGSISAGTPVLWSLSVEEYFYLLWAPTVLWLNRKWLIITGVTICVTAFLFRCFAFIGTASCVSIFHRFDGLIFGSFVALLISSKLPRRIVKAILLGAGCVGFVMLVVVLVPMGDVLNREIREDHIFVTFGLLAVSLLSVSGVGLAVANSGSRSLFLLRFPALRFIGSISYSLYLFHGLVYLCFLQFCQPTWKMSFVALACAVGLSWLSFRFIEQPLLNGSGNGQKTLVASPKLQHSTRLILD
jgi:peptidoglycan/LPS O-acetylase OafA/YrhL